MAIGDTIQAGLLKADFSPIERGGAAKGRAYSAIGGSIGGAIEKFAKNKQEGEAAEMGINGMIAGMDDQQKEELLSGDSEFSKTYDKFLNGDLTNSQKKTFLGGLVTFNTAQRQNMADQMAQDKFAIQQAEEQRKAENFNRDQQNLINENQFMQSLMSQTTSPQAQRQADIAMPGLPALGNADARNRFMQAQLQQPQNQVPVSNLGSQDFGRFAREQGLDPTRSVQRMEALRQAELANQPKALSPSDQLAREKYEDKKAEDVQETETVKVESTNNLTDFYNETKSLLDKINEKGVDVTGPIEGTSIYRFFSKLGDTNDEQVRRRLEMFTRKLTLDAAQNLKGALSDKDIRFLVEQAPDMDDNPSVWKKYMGDLVLRLERNANQQGIELGVSQTANTIDPADIQSEIDRKKQMIRDRDLQNKYFDNPNIQNLGNVNQGN